MTISIQDIYIYLLKYGGEVRSIKVIGPNAYLVTLDAYARRARRAILCPAGEYEDYMDYHLEKG